MDLLRRIDVDAMMLSAASDPETIRKALRHGALAYLIKPFSAQLLESRLRGYARYRRLLAEPGALSQDRLETAWQALHPARRGRGPQAGLGHGDGRAGRPGPGRGPVHRRRGQGRGHFPDHGPALPQALADDGAVVISLRYGATGRPEHRYSAATR